MTCNRCDRNEYRNPITEDDLNRLNRSKSPWLSRRIFSGFSKYEAFRYIRELYKEALKAFDQESAKPLYSIFIEMRDFLDNIGPGSDRYIVRDTAYQLFKKLCSKLLGMSGPIEKKYSKKMAWMVQGIGNLLVAFSNLDWDAIEELLPGGVKNVKKGALRHSWVSFEYPWWRLKEKSKTYRMNSKEVWLLVLYEADKDFSEVVAISDKQAWFRVRLELINRIFRKHKNEPPPGALPPSKYYGPHYPPSRKEQRISRDEVSPKYISKEEMAAQIINLRQQLNYNIDQLAEAIYIIGTGLQKFDKTHRTSYWTSLRHYGTRRPNVGVLKNSIRNWELGRNLPNWESTVLLKLLAEKFNVAFDISGIIVPRRYLLKKRKIVSKVIPWGGGALSSGNIVSPGGSLPKDKFVQKIWELGKEAAERDPVAIRRKRASLRKRTTERKSSHSWKYCPYCTKELQPDWKCCPYCGKCRNPSRFNRFGWRY